MDFALGCTADREKDRTGQYRTGQDSTVQYRRVQYSTVQYSTVQDRTVLESISSTIRLIINEAQRSSYA